MQECAICLSDCSTRSYLRCGHFFHKRCLDSWFAVRNTCPMCREPANYIIQIHPVNRRRQTVIPSPDSLEALTTHITTMNRPINHMNTFPNNSPNATRRRNTIARAQRILRPVSADQIEQQLHNRPPRISISGSLIYNIHRNRPHSGSSNSISPRFENNTVDPMNREILESRRQEYDRIYSSNFSFN